MIGMRVSGKTIYLTLMGSLLVWGQAPDVAKLQATLERNQRVLSDWPNLGRYREENAKLAPAAADEKRVVFMGDSITDGWGRKYGKFFPGKPYVNRGIGGQTTPQMLLRFRADVLSLEPKAGVILVGTNHIVGNTRPMSLGGIEDKLMSMGGLAKAHGVRGVLSPVMA